jgi:hypothetical protein
MHGQHRIQRSGFAGKKAVMAGCRLCWGGAGYVGDPARAMDGKGLFIGLAGAMTAKKI